jgi:hypothetical protein
MFKFCVTHRRREGKLLSQLPVASLQAVILSALSPKTRISRGDPKKIRKTIEEPAQ